MKKEYFNIPNLMGYFRILMIPVFLILYGRADTAGDYFLAFFVLALSYLTDFFDGKIARKFNMVTDWGKMLDPIADKLTQGALALACTFHYPAAAWLLFLFLCKELYMGVMGLFLIKKGRGVHGAERWGKICTAVLDVGILLLLLFPGLSFTAANLITAFMIIVMGITWADYLIFHICFLRNRERKKRPVILCGVLLLILYMIIGAVIPYRKGPEISETYKAEFSREDFYGNGISCDRAAIIEDNGKALEERIRMIENAEESICMSTFDFKSDTSGKQLLAALQAAADRGVQVKILADGFESRLHMTGNPWFYALAANKNAEIKIYNPANPLVPWKGMSRMHDKYLIVDDRLYLLGGRNAYDYFLGDQEGYKNYDRDVLVYNTEADSPGGGESSVFQIREYFDKIWDLKICRPWNEGSFISGIPVVKQAVRELHELYTSIKADHGEWFRPVDYQEQTVPVHKISLLSNPTGLYGKEPRVFYGLCRLMEGAEKEVLIHTPYIICDEQMYGELETVSRAVPSVVLMTNSSGNNGNPFGAVDYVLNKERILETGLHVLEYEGGVSYHGKSIAIDDDIAIVGSFNMDMKSTYQDTELMLVVHSEELNEQLKSNLLEYQKKSVEAVLDEKELPALTAPGVPWKKRIERGIIRLLDPYIRFLM